VFAQGEKDERKVEPIDRREVSDYLPQWDGKEMPEQKSD